MSSRRDAAVTAPDGQALEQTISLKSMKLPGRMGYGIAVPEPGRAVPYLVMTHGQQLVRIQDFKIFGFRSVIDLGTLASEASLHRIETEAAGMQYFNISVSGIMPNPEQTRFYNQIVLNANNSPLLIYAPTASLNAIMWASYRISLGSPLEFALHEGRSMGLTKEQELGLKIQVQRSSSK